MSRPVGSSPSPSKFFTLPNGLPMPQAPWPSRRRLASCGLPSSSCVDLASTVTAADPAISSAFGTWPFSGAALLWTSPQHPRTCSVLRRMPSSPSRIRRTVYGMNELASATVVMPMPLPRLPWRTRYSTSAPMGPLRTHPSAPSARMVIGSGSHPPW